MTYTSATHVPNFGIGVFALFYRRERNKRDQAKVMERDWRIESYKVLILRLLKPRMAV